MPAGSPARPCTDPAPQSLVWTGAWTQGHLTSAPRSGAVTYPACLRGPSPLDLMQFTAWLPISLGRSEARALARDPPPFATSWLT